MEHKIPESQTLSDLPMVVYLNGEENYLKDFSLDADQAMDMLGIKRSRLTQISGRELRVGRIRRDRYIRPVYRVKDLEDYRSWTRSTASSQSSAQALEKVIEKLSLQMERLKYDSDQNICNLLVQNRKSLQNLIESESLRHKKVVKSQKQELLMLEVSNRKLIHHLEHRIEELALLLDQCTHQWVQETKTVESILQELYLEVKSVGASSKARDELLRQDYEKDIGSMKSLLVGLVDEVKQVQREVYEPHSQVLKTMEDFRVSLDRLESLCAQQRDTTPDTRVQRVRTSRQSGFVKAYKGSLVHRGTKPRSHDA